MLRHWRDRHPDPHDQSARATPRDDRDPCAGVRAWEHSWKDGPMHAVIGRVKIKPDRADEALAMIGERGVAMLQGMAGSAGGHWARSPRVTSSSIPSGSSIRRKTPGQRRRPSTSFAICPMRQPRSSASMSARLSGTPRTAAESMLISPRSGAAQAVTLATRLPRRSADIGACSAVWWPPAVRLAAFQLRSAGPRRV